MRPRGVEQPPGGLGDAGKACLQPLVVDLANPAMRNVGGGMDDDVDAAKRLNRRIDQ